MAAIDLARRVKHGLARRLGRGSGPRVDPETVYYIHIPKTAGTQIKLVIDALTAAEVRPPLVGHTHHIGLSALPPEAPYFFSLRDPVSRFRSSFYHRKRKGQPLWFKEWSPGERRVFETFEHATDMAEALFTDTAEGRIAVEGMLSVKHVNMDQSKWLLHEGSFLELRPPVHILRLESLEDDLDVLLTALGIDERPAFVTDERANTQDYTAIPPMSDRAAENLRTWYARDVEVYKMCDAWATRNAELVRAR